MHCNRLESAVKLLSAKVSILKLGIYALQHCSLPRSLVNSECFNPKTRNLCIATLKISHHRNIPMLCFNPKTRNLCIATVERLQTF